VARRRRSNPLGQYILDTDGNPVPEPDLLVWGRWLEDAGDLRRVARDELPSGIVVSTVFLGIDHNWFDYGPPVLFETLVFNDYGEISAVDGRRYATRGEALAGHQTILRYAREYEKELLPQKANDNAC